MAGYSTSAPAMLLTQTIADKGPALWTLTGVDSQGTVATNGYISNAQALGLKKGDVVLYTNTAATPIANFFFNVVAINANGSADLSDGTAILATNAG